MPIGYTTSETIARALVLFWCYKAGMLLLRHEPTPEEREEIALELLERSAKAEHHFYAHGGTDYNDMLNIKNRGLEWAFVVVDRISKGHFYKFKPFTKTERRHYARAGTNGRRGARRIRANCDCMDPKWEKL